MLVAVGCRLLLVLGCKEEAWLQLGLLTFQQDALVQEGSSPPHKRLCLRLVWLGLVAGACDGIIVFPLDLLGLGWFGRRRM